MSTSWKKKFQNLCEAYSDIITPQPGKYNGAYGRVSTDINFATKPPTNLDLSNYYYQGGVPIEASQYLATVHPFKGLLVYTVEPQGLMNSGEHAYERFGRIYGDLCANEKLTRMADGLYVLGNTFGELFENLHEVFERARTANLTFKPSKILICPQDTIIFGWRKKGNA